MISLQCHVSQITPVINYCVNATGNSWLVQQLQFSIYDTLLLFFLIQKSLVSWWDCSIWEKNNGNSNALTKGEAVPFNELAISYSPNKNKETNYFLLFTHSRENNKKYENGLRK